VGTKFQALFWNDISIGPLLAIGGSFSLVNLVNKLLTMISLDLYCMFHVFLIVTLYSLFFQSTFCRNFLETIDIPRGTIGISFNSKDSKGVNDTDEMLIRTRSNINKTLTEPVDGKDQHYVTVIPSEQIILNILDIFLSFPGVKE
jgi:hypothetical protein